jgi:hypothetical protein
VSSIGFYGIDRGLSILLISIERFVNIPTGIYTLMVAILVPWPFKVVDYDPILGTFGGKSFV